MTTLGYGPRKVGKLYDARDVAGLVRVLSDGKESAAAAAAYALGRLGGSDVVPGLVDALSDERWAVRSRAVDALGSLIEGAAINGRRLDGPARARLIDAMTAFLHSDASDFERATAASALGKTRDQKVVEPLLAAVAPTSAGRAAAVALCELSDPIVLSDAWWRDEEDSPRGLQLRDPRIFWALFDVLVAGRWDAPLRSRGNSRAVSEWLRLVAIPETVPELVGVAHGSDADRSRLALDIVRETEWGPEAGEALRAATSSDTAAVRAAAAEALSSSAESGGAGMEELLHAASDDDASVRAAAIKGLAGHATDAAAAEALVRALSDEEFSVRREAAHVLADHPHSEAVPWLLAALGDGVYQTWPFVRALRACQDPRAIGGLERVAMRPGDDWGRTEAIAALAELNARDTAPGLRLLLDDKSGAVRESAATALRELGRENDARPGSFGPAAWRRQVVTTFLLSAVIAVPIWRWGVTPLTDEGWSGSRWASLWMLAAVYGGVYLAWRGFRDHEGWERLGRWGQTAAAAVAIPLVLAGAAWWLAPAHAAQDEVAAVFERYTHRFPAGVLSEPHIERHSERFLTVCAQQGPVRPDGSRYFCAGIDPDRPAGRQVVGGYRLSPSTDWTPTDCFGASAVCASGYPEPVYE